MTRLEAENERLKQATLHEREYWERGYTLAGMDEAGRGPLAGPVVAACAVMPPEPLIPYVKDSKQLSEQRREELFEKIVQTAEVYGVGIVGAKEIDETNILVATRKAFRAAYADLNFTPGAVFTDAMEGLNLPAPTRSFIHGDRLCYTIAAASIIAKVTRDRLMREMDQVYPVYGFARHKGYGTDAHYAALREYGPCPEHRLTFLKSMNARPAGAGGKRARQETDASGGSAEYDGRWAKSRSREKGLRGEELACELLAANGFRVIERNFRIRGAEIDIIALRADLMIFVEVKARDGDAFGAGREAVTPKKQEKIIAAARQYAANGGIWGKYMRFDVIEVDLAYESAVHIEGAFRVDS